MDITLRTKETQKRYEDYLKTNISSMCCFCREIMYSELNEKSEITHKWNHWYLMPNAYPYDVVYKDHHLLFSKRHVSYEELTVKEIKEYEYIMSKLRPGYHQLVENLGDRISQKGHYHVHLCRFK